jgi:hypothetical protein
MRLALNEQRLVPSVLWERDLQPPSKVSEQFVVQGLLPRVSLLRSVHKQRDLSVLAVLAKQKSSSRKPLMWGR